MIIDATNVPQDREIKGDLCIVGAGAAGIVIAREFAGSTFQVIVLESGGLEYSPETQALNEGVVLETSDGLGPDGAHFGTAFERVERRPELRHHRA